MIEFSEAVLKWIWMTLIWLHIALALLLALAKLFEKLGFIKHPARGRGFSTFLHNFL
jgi:hypothetical protein